MAFYGGKEPPGSVAVAVSGSRSEMAVSWAAENLFPDARRVLLLHVIPSISAVPEPCAYFPLSISPSSLLCICFSVFPVESAKRGCSAHRLYF